MAYIGKAPNTAIVNQATSQSFSGNGSTTAFTLTRSVNVGEDLEVFVNNVQQEPGSGKSYTASGTTLTFDEAPPSGTNNVYVIYRGEATINPRLEHDANAALAATTGTFSGAVSGTDGTFTGGLTVDTDTLKVDSTNNRVGIGTTSPASDLHVVTSDYKAAQFEGPRPTLFFKETDGSADENYQIRLNGGDLRFQSQNDAQSNAVDRMTIDSSGNVGIGETSPLGTVHIRTSDASLTTVNGNADDLILENNGNCGMSICSSTTGEGNLNFIDSGDTNIGRIQYTHSDNKMGFRIKDVAAMELEADGSNRPRANIGGDDPSSNSYFTITGDNAAHVMLTTVSPNGGAAVRFKVNGNVVGQIGQSTTSTSYGTSSDHRLKENVADMTGAIARVKQLAPKRFNFIADADTTVDGFLAHEAQAVVPEAITGTHNEVDDDGNAVMQGIDQSKLVPLLTGALKEAITKIEALETKVAALEGN